MDDDIIDLPPLPPMERLVDLTFDACRQGRDDVLPALLQAGVDIEVRDARGFSPLVIASYNGQETTTALLLAMEASPDGPSGATGNTALMGVAFKGYEPIARRLIDAGADVNRRNGVGQTALMMAALFGQVALVDLLLAAGADRDARDEVGHTASSLAITQGNAAMVERLARRP